MSMDDICLHHNCITECHKKHSLPKYSLFSILWYGEKTQRLNICETILCFLYVKKLNCQNENIMLKDI